MDNRDISTFGNQARDLLLKKLLKQETAERKAADEKLAKDIEEVASAKNVVKNIDFKQEESGGILEITKVTAGVTSTFTTPVATKYVKKLETIESGDGFKATFRNFDSVDTEFIFKPTHTNTELYNTVSTKSTVSVSESGTATDEISYITVDGTEKKIAGEPDAYLKSASVSGNTLTLVNKDSTTVTYTPDLTTLATKTELASEVTRAAVAESGLADDIEEEAITRSSAIITVNERLDSIEGLGRFLSNWNCESGLPETYPTPTSYPYTYNYKSGDYFIISAVGSTNSKPAGGSISKQSASTPWVISTATESNVVKINDYYIYDGSVWKLIENSQRTVTFSSISGQPTDNANLSTTLNSKLNTSGGSITGNIIPATGSTVTLGSSASYIKEVYSNILYSKGLDINYNSFIGAAIGIRKDSSQYATQLFFPGSSAADTRITFPDKTGTLATLDDIPTVASASYSESNTSLTGLTIGSTTYKLIPFSTYYNSIGIGNNTSIGEGYCVAVGNSSCVGGATGVAVGYGARCQNYNAVALGYEAYTNIAGTFSIDKRNQDPLVWFMHSPDKVFFRNENVSQYKYSLADYTNGKTLQSYLDEKLTSPVIESGDAGKAIKVKADLSGYELGSVGSLPELPSASVDGSYILKATKSNGVITYEWIPFSFQ